MQIDLQNIIKEFQRIQDDICGGLEALDGKAKFEADKWDRPGGGGGLSRVIQNGAVFEKGGVNFSHVYGQLPEKISQALKLPDGIHFDATGVSIVIHPESPHIPIVHMNIRYFQMEDGTYWFGGGIDMTPIYILEDEAKSFHRTLKSTCDAFDHKYYPAYKKWCDEYFYIKHRKEMRGIGGIFFDHLREGEGRSKGEIANFVFAVGDAFLKAYQPIVLGHIAQPYSEEEKQFQLFRRSRYVEFNLVYDKGTKFGLDTDGRIESILMSMPPLASWTYQYQPDPGSREEETLQMLQPRDWLVVHS